METLAELHKLAVRRKKHRDALDLCLKERQNSELVGMVRHHLYHLAEYAEEMKKTVSKAKKETKGKAEFIGFANVELTLEEKEEGRIWIREDEKVGVELDEMAASGYKLSVVKSEAMGAYQATAYCQNADDVNAGRILSAYAPSWFDALAMLAFKHAVVCEGVWPVKDEARGDLWG